MPLIKHTKANYPDVQGREEVQCEMTVTASVTGWWPGSQKEIVQQTEMLSYK